MKKMTNKWEYREPEKPRNTQTNRQISNKTARQTGGKTIKQPYGLLK